jgi:hypothetical protein
MGAQAQSFESVLACVHMEPRKKKYTTPQLGKANDKASGITKVIILHQVVALA